MVGDDLTIKLFWPNNVMRRTGIWLERGSQVTSDIFDHNSHENPINSHHWLDPSKAEQWILYQSFTAMPYYSHSLFLLTAESTEGAADYLDGIEDSADQWPKW